MEKLFFCEWLWKEKRIYFSLGYIYGCRFRWVEELLYRSSKVEEDFKEEVKVREEVLVG